MKNYSGETGRDEGRVKLPFPYPAKIKSKEPEGLIRRGIRKQPFSSSLVPENYRLAPETNMRELRYTRTARTGFLPTLVEPEFTTRRAQVRWRVRHLNLSGLDPATRRDAAADPSIEWDPVERQYRIRRRGKAGTRSASAVQSDPSADHSPSAPAPAPADLDSAEGQGGSKCFRVSQLPTGGDPECESKHAIFSKNRELARDY